MTEHEENMQEKYAEEAQKYVGKVKELSRVANDLNASLHTLNLFYMNNTPRQIRILIQDGLVTAKRLDTIYHDDFADGFAPALRKLDDLRDAIQAEHDGYDPDPTFGMSNADFF